MARIEFAYGHRRWRTSKGFGPWVNWWFNRNRIRPDLMTDAETRRALRAKSWRRLI